MVNYTDLALTQFVELIIDEHTETPRARTRGGRYSSVHNSTNLFDYPNAHVQESPILHANSHVRTMVDTILTLKRTHMGQHVKLVLQFAVELAFASLE